MFLATGIRLSPKAPTGTRQLACPGFYSVDMAVVGAADRTSAPEESGGSGSSSAGSGAAGAVVAVLLLGGIGAAGFAPDPHASFLKRSEIGTL